MLRNRLIIALAITLGITAASFTHINHNKSLVKATTNVNSGKADSAEATSTLVNTSVAIYNNLDLSHLGLSKDAFNYAIKGYQKLLSEGKVSNNQYLTIVDFSQSSRSKRFYLIDMKNQQLVMNTFVAHGKNSGVDMAERFSNNANSNESSLGFYVTESTYTGKHGMSLRINGQEPGFNDNAEARGVVVHGAPYVTPSRVNSAYMGRSQGCPALPLDQYAKAISYIKDGSVMFLYSPMQDYLQHSTLLNG
jgi:hypothetical protein